MAQLIALEQVKKGNTTEFDERVSLSNGRRPGLYSAPKLRVIQVNIGLRCNLTCVHCHVNSSPRRREEMDWETMEAVLRFARVAGVETIDITGGAPEMHRDFKRFVAALRKQGHQVMVRTNLTILLEPGYEDFPEFFRDHQVRLVASLPCYLEKNVDKQRGEGVYQESINVIRKLNKLGYGRRPELVLTLVYNPIGAYLPPDQAELENDYRRELSERYDIQFTGLYTITNAPIGRFRGDLRRSKKLDSYLDLLRGSFNPETVEPLMCRHQVSVRWDGALHDCDFNLALGWSTGFGASTNIREVDLETVISRRIVTGDHCYACTGGAGSSCGGSLV